MKQQTRVNAEKYISSYTGLRGKLKRVVALLCAVVIFLTVSSLKKNADTLERIPMCGMRAHAHSEACYDDQGRLACGLEAHAHTDACYQQRPARRAANTRIDEFIPLNASVRLTSNDVVVTADRKSVV